jgi:phenylacetate-coenzyme A ligase PaaK-like adenylate-forming protein
MFVTALALLRFAASLIFGVSFSRWALDKLVDALCETHREFGMIGAEGTEMLQGPTLTLEEQQETHLRLFRTQAQRAAQETPYYQHLFAELQLDLARLTYADIARIPITLKDAVRLHPAAFVRNSTQPAFRTTTTGTTGKPTSICFSAEEMHSYTSLATIGLLARGEVTPEDVVQISTSARATLSNTCLSRACERIGAIWYQTGLVEPAQALAYLVEQHALPGKKHQVSYFVTYPSYLGQVVECGLAAGYGPADFGVERISVGGELVSNGLKGRAQQLFGPVLFSEGYAMTETWPTVASLCEQGHLHFEISQAMWEVIEPESKQPAQPGEAGMLVVTPLPPYRMTTLLLRYNTEDLVRVLTMPLTCSQRHLPATSNLLGKLKLAVRHEQGWTYPRDVVEALEAVEEVPLPARWGYWAVPGGVAVEVVARSDSRATQRKIEAALQAQGVPLQTLHLVRNPQRLQHPFPLRCDLRELDFTPPKLPVPPPKAQLVDSRALLLRAKG